MTKKELIEIYCKKGALHNEKREQGEQRDKL